METRSALRCYCRVGKTNGVNQATRPAIDPRILWDAECLR